MGTSSPFGGPGNNTPLLPDWADDDITEPSNDENNEPSPEEDDTDSPPDPEISESPDISPENDIEKESEPELEPLRFRLPRSNFTRYINSNGTDTGALGRAIKSYVSKSAGGSRTAAQRMTGSRRVAGNLLNVLRDINAQGVVEVLRTLALDSLIGKSPKDILIAFTDIICSPGGSIDEDIARDAYVETIIEITNFTDNLETINEEQINVITTRFITHTIVNRIFIDIGQSLDMQTLSGEDANYLSKSTFDFVLGIVQDRLISEIQNTRNLGAHQMKSAIDKIYQIGFGQLENEINAL